MKLNLYECQDKLTFLHPNEIGDIPRFYLFSWKITQIQGEINSFHSYIQRFTPYRFHIRTILGGENVYISILCGPAPSIARNAILLTKLFSKVVRECFACCTNENSIFNQTFPVKVSVWP